MAYFPLLIIITEAFLKKRWIYLLKVFPLGIEEVCYLVLTMEILLIRKKVISLIFSLLKISIKCFTFYHFSNASLAKGKKFWV